jgi:hypothetical protein
MHLSSSDDDEPPAAYVPPADPSLQPPPAFGGAAPAAFPEGDFGALPGFGDASPGGLSSFDPNAGFDGDLAGFGGGLPGLGLDGNLPDLDDDLGDLAGFGRATRGIGDPAPAARAKPNRGAPAARLSVFGDDMLADFAQFAGAEPPAVPAFGDAPGAFPAFGDPGGMRNFSASASTFDAFSFAPSFGDHADFAPLSFGDDTVSNEAQADDDVDPAFLAQFHASVRFGGAAPKPVASPFASPFAAPAVSVGMSMPVARVQRIEGGPPPPFSDMEPVRATDEEPYAPPEFEMGPIPVPDDQSYCNEVMYQFDAVELLQYLAN